jgi:hypothetical protein
MSAADKIVAFTNRVAAEFKVIRTAIEDATSYVRKENNGSDFEDPNQVRITIGAHATMDVISQAEAEAGTETVERSWTAKRVGQAINAQATGALLPILNTKAPLASPVLTGTPTAPTPLQTVDNDQLATTHYVHIAIDNLKTGAPALYDTLAKIGTWLEANDTELAQAISFKASLVSPAFTGTPTAPTPVGGTNTTQIATTEFVASGFYTKAQADAKFLTGSTTTFYTKTEVDTALGGKLDKTGGTTTGQIISTGGGFHSNYVNPQFIMTYPGVRQWYLQVLNDGRCRIVDATGGTEYLSFAPGQALGDLNTRIENRAIAWANDRVANLQYRHVSLGSASLTGTTGWKYAPGGSLYVGMYYNGSNYQYGTYAWVYPQVYDPVRGWVGFSQAY